MREQRGWIGRIGGRSLALAAAVLCALPARGQKTASLPPAQTTTAAPGAAASPFGAIGPAAALAAAGPFRPQPGAWAEYAVRRAGMPPARIRISVLPEPAPEGRQWIEVVSATAAGLAVATRALFRGDPSQPGAVERLLVSVAGQPPFELPLDQAGAPAPRAPEKRVRATALPPEQIAVPAGSFRAERVRVADGKTALTIWRAPQVPLWGIVRTRGAGGGAELLAYATTGAHSLVPAGAAPRPPEAQRSADAPQGNGSESAK